VRLTPGLLETDVALRTVSEALATAACRILELEPQELQAEFRPALTPRGRLGNEAEVYLYDTLPGGAGFARRLGELGRPLFDEALRLLESCPDGCDRSCYRCLRSYKNKFEHELLDRHIGAALLRRLLYGAPPVLSESRIERSRTILFEDLTRQSVPGIAFERGRTLDVPGLGKIAVPILAVRRDGEHAIIDITHPLMPTEPCSDTLKDVMEFTATPVLLVEELVVAKNLPYASSSLIRRLGQP
jgi:hypothetical protein